MKEEGESADKPNLIQNLDPHVLKKRSCSTSSFNVSNLDDFLALEIPQKEYVLDPIIQKQGLIMIQAGRGVGKTFFSLGLAVAVASGGSFLKWKSPVPRKVTYIDGEMPANTMQDRLAATLKTTTTTGIDGNNFNLLTPDLQPNGTPNLLDLGDQSALESHLEGSDLVVIDNISTLVRGSASENDDRSWGPIQSWLLGQRSKGRSVLLVHHEGKGGAQRGTSKREDVLDLVVRLKHPADYDPSDGAKFEVVFMKARGLYGDDVRPFEVKLDPGTGRWSFTDLEDSTLEKVVALYKDGLKQTDIAIELEVNKSTVSRHLKKARREGLIS